LSPAVCDGVHQQHSRVCCRFPYFFPDFIKNLLCVKGISNFIESLWAGQGYIPNHFILI